MKYTFPNLESRDVFYLIGEFDTFSKHIENDPDDSFVESKNNAIKLLYNLYFFINYYSKKNNNELLIPFNKKEIITSIFDATNYDELIKGLSNFKTIIYELSYRLNVGARNSGRLNCDVKWNTLHESSTKEYNYDEILNTIKFNQKETNIFVCGIDLSREINITPSANVNYYGISYGKAQYYNTIKSQYKSIFNNVSPSDFVFDAKFDVAIGSLTGSLYTTSNAFSNSYDGLFSKNFYYLNSRVRKGGYLILTLKSSLISYENIFLISEYLNNVSVYMTEDMESYILIGTCTKKKNSNIDVFYNIIKQIIFKDPVAYERFSSYEREYPVIFRTRLLTIDYVKECLENQDEEVHAFNESIFNMLDENSKDIELRKPMIPFTPGQLGLVLVSGDIDGIIDEGNGCYHAIKGTVYREDTLIDQTEEGNKRTDTSVNSVHTSVNVVLADGTFITLK